MWYTVLSNCILKSVQSWSRAMLAARSTVFSVADTHTAVACSMFCCACTHRHVALAFAFLWIIRIRVSTWVKFWCCMPRDKDLVCLLFLNYIRPHEPLHAHCTSFSHCWPSVLTGTLGCLITSGLIACFLTATCTFLGGCCPKCQTVVVLPAGKGFG